MRLGIVSDTHGHLAYTEQAVDALRERRPDVVLHCGDIGSPEVVGLFAEWPTHFVFGNVDFEQARLRSVIEATGLTCHNRFGALELDGRRIAFLHGDDTQRLRDTIGGGEFDLVCHGHTHVADLYRQQTTLVLNPGALYRATPHSLAVVDLPALDVEHIEV